ncbi:MAG: hypothetical protein ABI229_03690 [Gemmatimonadaceae bacterium]
MITRTRILVPACLLAFVACGGGRTAANSAIQADSVAATAATATPTQAESMATANARKAQAADSVTYKHHSTLAGAAVGAAAGHMLGGHAVLGAAAGALIQHERNKHQAAVKP